MAQIFQAGRKQLPLTKTYIMGILNITPDSFYDGGRYTDLSSALTRAKALEAQGADIIDIGAQSTRPGYIAISPEEEWKRLKDILPAVLAETNALISIDTFYPEVAKLALNAGADIINDISGFSQEMFESVASSACGLIVMHNQTIAQNAILEVNHFFADKLNQALSIGISANRLCFDPGIGFAKTHHQNLSLLANTSQVKLQGYAYLMAASRKRVIGYAGGGETPDDRLYGTISAHSAAQWDGADILRAHDVEEAALAAHVIDTINQYRLRNDSSS